MHVSSVGSQQYSGAMMELPATRCHQGNRCSCEGEVAASSSKLETGGESNTRAERQEHHGHREHHGHHGGRFGHGNFAMGMGRYINEQMHAARREVVGEQIGAAVSELTSKVAEVIGASGQQEGLDAVQEQFTAALQDVVDRFDNGEIGRRRAMAGFRAAYEDLVDAVRADSASQVPVADAEIAAETDAAGVGSQPASEAEPLAEDPAGGSSVSLVENLGQVFNSFMQGLRSDFSALGGMQAFMSPENRDKILETFVGLYRELAGLNAVETKTGAESTGIDQLV